MIVRPSLFQVIYIFLLYASPLYRYERPARVVVTSGDEYTIFLRLSNYSIIQKHLACISAGAIIKFVI